MARIRLQLWDVVVSDCDTCLALNPDSMKAHYYRSQALLAQLSHDEALSSAVKAQELCAASGDKSLAVVTAHVLHVRKARWDSREKRRRREADNLEWEVVALLAERRDRDLSEADAVDREDIQREWEEKNIGVRNVFDRARRADDAKREVPEWAIDDISFQVMVDPVLVSACM